MMNRKSNLSKINWPQVISIVIALAGLILGGGFFYNEVWKSKALTYTVLPTYDAGGQSFSGLVIENRGRVPLTDVHIILSNLEAPIESLNIPGPHEPAQLISGGEGQTELFIKMPRLSSGAPPLSIYILTFDTLTLKEGKTFFVSSKEVAGTPSEKEPTTSIWIITAFGGMGASLMGSLLYSLVSKTERGLEKAEGQLVVKSARYGAQDRYNDVADRVRSAISAGRIDEMPVNNDYFGPDPIERVPKQLIVDYVYAGRDYSKTVPENGKLTLP
ncbi:MAG: hypothetical protein ACETWD_07230 [Desulfatiglandales bacterium]